MSSPSSIVRRYAVAGALASVIWCRVEPLLRRIFGHPYSDPALVTAFITRGRAQRVLDYALQATGGALFGGLFAHLGGRTARQGVKAALVENTPLIPLLPLIDRYHPYVRDGEWPPVSKSPRAAAVSFSGHALFGLLLGLLGRVLSGQAAQAASPARTEIHIAAPPEAVWDVLADADTYAEWVVGTQHIARADGSWPEPGSALEYRVGVGPISVGDHTTVVEADEPRHLLLRAQLKHLGAFAIRLALEARDGGTHVVMEEAPLEGALVTVHNPLSEAALARRNDAALGRLKRLAEARA
jgi:uncharacterized protein YndB with AHSA1/START domain